MKLRTNHIGSARAQLLQPGFGAYTCTAALVGLLWIFCPIGVAQKAPPALRLDPFIHAIERMKHSLASMDCLIVNGDQAKIVERPGSAIVISEAGDFLTAAHVIQEMQKDEHLCPTLAIIFPDSDWRPEDPTSKCDGSRSKPQIVEGTVLSTLQCAR